MAPHLIESWNGLLVEGPEWEDTVLGAGPAAGGVRGAKVPAAGRWGAPTSVLCLWVASVSPRGCHSFLGLQLSILTKDLPFLFCCRACECLPYSANFIYFWPFSHVFIKHLSFPEKQWENLISQAKQQFWGSRFHGRFLYTSGRGKVMTLVSQPDVRKLAGGGPPQWHVTCICSSRLQAYQTRQGSRLLPIAFFLHIFLDGLPYYTAEGHIPLKFYSKIQEGLQAHCDSCICPLSIRDADFPNSQAG